MGFCVGVLREHELKYRTRITFEIRWIICVSKDYYNSDSIVCISRYNVIIFERRIDYNFVKADLNLTNSPERLTGVSDLKR